MLNYWLVGATAFFVVTTLLFAWLWLRSSRLREEEKNEMIGCFVQNKAEKISRRKSEILVFEDPRTNLAWLPKIVWKNTVDPYLVDFWVLDPLVPINNFSNIDHLEDDYLESLKKNGLRLAKFEVNFHEPLNYGVIFRGDEVFFREKADDFHALFKRFVEAQSPWEVEKIEARIHKSKSPNKKVGDSIAVAAGK